MPSTTRRGRPPAGRDAGARAVRSRRGRLRAMAPAFLIGGGRDDVAVRASHAGFVRAAGSGRIVAIALDEGDDTDPERWTGALRLAGAAEVRALVVSPA